MAGFCKQCSNQIFGQDRYDFAGLCQHGQTIEVLCEGCGFVAVDGTGARATIELNQRNQHDACHIRTRNVPRNLSLTVLL